MAKGIKTGGGSRKGRPNKHTAEIREMIEGALHEAGGQAYLVRQAEDNPTAFPDAAGKDSAEGSQSGRSWGIHSGYSAKNRRRDLM